MHWKNKKNNQLLRGGRFCPLLTFLEKIEKNEK